MDRVSVYTEENPDNKLSLSYSYYVANKKLKTLLEEINGHPRGASYVYDNDERLKSYQKANGKREYTYDDFDRVPTYVTKHKNDGGTFDAVLTTAFTFASSAVSTTSTRVASMSQEGNGFTQDYSYTYDKNGNILSVTDPNGTTTYEYDSLGQLLRENNQAGNFTHVWEYDNAGNILSRKEYAYTTGTISENTPYNDIVIYGYNDDKGWGDLLTSYDGEPIFYDEIGNPERIGDLTLIWQHGRQLASMTDGETTWQYTYNADGLRTKRTDGTNTYEYVYYGGLLQYMEYNNTPVYFTHAPDGTPMGMLTGGNAYFYITNLQGDVVGIVDATGNLLVSYTYDAWGNPLSTTGTLANTIGTLNPLRYRGYVYDTETGLYYLQSRYYNSELGRFISSDGQLNPSSLLGYNLYTYCDNNPVLLCDVSGQAPGLRTNYSVISDDITTAVVIRGKQFSVYAVSSNRTADSNKTAVVSIVDNQTNTRTVLSETTQWEGMIGTYNQLRYIIQKHGLVGFEVHHIVEKRFYVVDGLKAFNGISNQAPCVIVTRGTHQGYTNETRFKFRYGTDYSSLNGKQVIEFYYNLYGGRSDLQEQLSDYIR